jgi:hypothetical protein
MSAPVRFDAAYYSRYYLDPETRIYDRPRHARLVAGIVNLIEWLGGPLDTVLDVGAGVGWWGEWFRKHRRGVRYTSTEFEREICRRYGHRQADLRTLRLAATFDLVVCQGVLPYLDDAGAEAGIANLAKACAGFLYLEAITAEDADGAIDASRTDLRVSLRPTAWYRQRLHAHFREIGFGLYVSRGHSLSLYGLEAPVDEPPAAPPPET